MGQGDSKVVVHLHLDSGYYYAGDTVTGAVVLRVSQPMEVKSISVKVTGVEKTKWVERRQSSNPSHDVTYHGKHEVLKHKLPLHGPGTIHAGDYQWPISFTLPANVPGTFHYDAPDRRAKASIEYKVKAFVDQEGMFKADFKKTIRFDVLQHSKVAAPSGPLQLDRDAPISSWCCFNKGHISMRVAADSDSFLPGQAINVSTQVSNQSSTPVTLVEMKLHQRLHLMGSSFMGQISKHIDVVRVLSRQQALNGTQGAPGVVSQYAARLDLHPSLEATCLGKVIRSTYELEVTAKTGCCMSEVKVRQPIYINDPQPQCAAPSAAPPPPGWAPQVYSTVAIALPAPDYYNTWQQQQQQAPVMGTPAVGASPQPLYVQQQQQQQPAYQTPWPQGTPGMMNTPQAAGYGAAGASAYPPQQQQQQSYQPGATHQQQQWYQQDAQQYAGSAAGAYPPPGAGQHHQPQALSGYQGYPGQGYSGPNAPGAVCYIDPQLQQQGPQYIKADPKAGGYATNTAAAAPGHGLHGYPPQAVAAAPTAPNWPAY